jgi:MoxR-like ATPase
MDEEAARKLRDPKFLYNASRKVTEMGVVGEKRLKLLLILGCITRNTPEPVSIILKAPPGTGKTTLVRSVIRLFPSDCVIERAGLSKKALVHGKGSLVNKILFINEYRCGKDPQQLIRLTQSGEDIKHEYTTILGRRRKTEIAERVGTPVVLTTTTDEVIFPDDASRFLAAHVDDSPKQTLAILLARAAKPRPKELEDLPIWQAAMSKIRCRAADLRNPPEWLLDVAKKLPLHDARVRRDWSRILSFCSAAALLRGFESKGPVDITFEDYCVVYRILEPILAESLEGADAPEDTIARAVAKLNRRLERPVTVHEIAKELGWKESRVYKHLKSAVRRKLVKYQKGTRERNLRPIIARREGGHFLPRPRSILRRKPEIGKKVKYVDPFTGCRKKVTL